MARGRHVKRSGLLARLWPARRRRSAHRTPTSPAPVLLDRLTALDGEVSRLRVLGIAHAAAAASADVRSRRAEEQVLAVRAELAGSRAELAALRCDLAAVREELVWAYAEGRLPAAAGPAAVLDLRDGATRTA